MTGPSEKSSKSATAACIRAAFQACMSVLIRHILTVVAFIEIKAVLVH